MIVTRDFVFVHLPKNGGTFVSRAIEGLYPSRVTGPLERVVRRLSRTRGLHERYDLGRALIPVLGRIEFHKHGTSEQVPAIFDDRPWFTTIRNPFDRYVSIFEFGWWKQDRGERPWLADALRRFPHFPDLSFGEFLDLAQFIGPSSRLSAPHLPPVGLQTRDYINYVCRSTRRVIADVARATDLDEAAEIVRAARLPVELLRTERLNVDLVSFFEKVGLPSTVVSGIRTSARVFPPEGGRGDAKPWREYYTPDLADVVRRRERVLLALHPEYEYHG